VPAIISALAAPVFANDCTACNPAYRSAGVGVPDSVIVTVDDEAVALFVSVNDVLLFFVSTTVFAGMPVPVTVWPGCAAEKSPSVAVTLDVIVGLPFVVVQLALVLNAGLI
jgi:hypothetical protein